jgi:hypothetical protein
MCSYGSIIRSGWYLLPHGTTRLRVQTKVRRRHIPSKNIRDSKTVARPASETSAQNSQSGFLSSMSQKVSSSSPSNRTVYLSNVCVWRLISRSIITPRLPLKRRCIFDSISTTSPIENRAGIRGLFGIASLLNGQVGEHFSESVSDCKLDKSTSTTVPVLLVALLPSSGTSSKPRLRQERKLGGPVWDGSESRTVWREAMPPEKHRRSDNDNVSIKLREDVR